MISIRLVLVLIFLFAGGWYTGEFTKGLPFGKRFWIVMSMILVLIGARLLPEL